jgi:hypothetical protein
MPGSGQFIYKVYFFGAPVGDWGICLGGPCQKASGRSGPTKPTLVRLSLHTFGILRCMPGVLRDTKYLARLSGLARFGGED